MYKKQNKGIIGVPVSLKGKDDNGNPVLNIGKQLSNIDENDEKTLTNGTIPNANIPSGCLSVALKISRDVAGDTYSGTFQLISLRISQ